MKSKALMLSLLVTIGVVLFTYLTIRYAGSGDIDFKQGWDYAVLYPSTYAAIGIAGGLFTLSGIISIISLLAFAYFVFRAKYYGDMTLLKDILPLAATLILFVTFLLTPAYRLIDTTHVDVPVSVYNEAGGTIEGLRAKGIDADVILKTPHECYDWETQKYYTADNPVRPNKYFKDGKKLPNQ